MSRHVAPHRWSDAVTGKLDERELAAMDRHAATCRRCAAARERITRVSQSFPVLRTQAPPEVAWDAVRARVHWSVSTARHARLQPRRRAVAMVSLGGVVAGGIVLALATGPVPALPSAPAAAIVVVHEPKPTPPAEVTGLVSRLAGAVMIDGIRRNDAFERRLGLGTRLSTGDGRIDVQFGEATGFALGPRSTLELRRFDAESIELAVDGTVDIAVAPRAPGQRFVVIAGDQIVEVRGTQFRVTHDGGGTSVACRHGLVAVHGGGGEALVGAARKLFIRTGHPIVDARVLELSPDELAQLVGATPVTLPAWDGLMASSAPLEVATTGKQDVRVDGVELGEAPLRVRVMPGRHTVEATDGAGRFRRAGWVDVGAGRAARVDVVPPVEEAAPPGGVARRKHQLQAGIDHARLARCTRAIAKAGLTGTYVLIEISVDTAGAVNFLNVIDTDLPSTTASCVREVLADVRFGAGPAATWRDKLDDL